MRLAILASLISNLAFAVIVSQPTPSTDIKYAPAKEPVQGLFKLGCLGIKYQDQPDAVASAKECRDLVDDVAAFYRKNSRGLLQLKGQGFQVDVPFDGNARNYYRAEDYAVKQKPGFDYYMNVGRYVGTPHAGNKIAHLKNTLARDAEHEVGHLLGLGHAGAYKMENGKLELDAYGDGQSVMGRFPSGFLTAPQYYHLGWLRQDEVALHEPGKIYELRRVTDFDGKGLAAVLIQADSPNARDAFVSFPPACDACLSLHLSKDGGSQKVKTGKEFTDPDFTGLSVKIVGSTPRTLLVSIEHI